MLKKILIIWLILLKTAQAKTLGDVALALNSTLIGFNQLFSVAFYTIGLTLFMAGLIQYRQFRQNPVQSPLSRVLILLVSGIIVGFLPYATTWIIHYLRYFHH